MTNIKYNAPTTYKENILLIKGNNIYSSLLKALSFHFLISQCYISTPKLQSIEHIYQVPWRFSNMSTFNKEIINALNLISCNILSNTWQRSNGSSLLLFLHYKMEQRIMLNRYFRYSGYDEFSPREVHMTPHL